MSLADAEMIGIEAGEACLAKTERVIDPGFSGRAKEAILNRLRVIGEASCEDLTDHVIGLGIKPHDQRAFGPIFLGLSRSGQIKQTGWTPRRKGHSAPGGRVWGIA